MYSEYSVPISIKGVVIENGKVWLRKNERDEWELPGGKLDEGEQPEETIVRELQEELGFKVEVVDIINAYLYKIKKPVGCEKKGVLVVSYLCKFIEKIGEFELQGEAGEAEFEAFGQNQIKDLNMPEFYKDVVLKAFSL